MDTTFPSHAIAAASRPDPGRSASRRGWGWVVLVVALLLSSATLVAEDGAASAVPSADRSAGAANAAWLAAQLDDGRYANPLAPAPDYGLMIDAVFAMHAAGRGDLAQPILRVLDDDRYAQDFISFSSWSPRPDANRIGGATAKTVVAALVSGRDPRNFGGQDLVAELDGAITAAGPDRGRVRDHGPDIRINNANTFGQALAVLAFAGLGDHRQDVIAKLLWQQCAEGYFRIFYSFNTDNTPATCDEGKPRDRSAPDGDSTGIALSALLAARGAGVSGLDEPIARTRSWLLANQHASGGWGGGVNTEAPNTNSTGLIVQALAEAGGADAAVARGRAYLRSAQVTAADAGNDLRGEVGAIAYQPSEYELARAGGISGLDTWIRASAQASLGLSGVGFDDLVAGRSPVDPPTPTTTVPSPTTSTTPVRTTTTQSATPVPPQDRTGSPGAPSVPRPSVRAGTPGPAPGSGAPRPVRPVTPAVGDVASDTPAGRLGTFLVLHLTDGDHVEAEVDGDVVVDYDATADVALALRALDEQPSAARRLTAFLLEQASVDAYAHGVPYEDDDAAYVGPLAKLVVLAQLQRRDEGAPDPSTATVDGLVGALDDRRSGGTFTDAGTYGDEDGATIRHARATLALVARGDRAEDELDTLLASRCDDGSFPAVLDEAPCGSGDLAATAAALTALTAEPAANQPSPHRPAGRATPAGWSSERSTAAAEAAAILAEAVDDDGLVVADGEADLAATSAVASARSFAGADVATTTSSVAARQADDGGFTTGEASTEASGDRDSSNVGLADGLAASDGLVGRSWAGSDLSPVVAALRVRPAAADRTTGTADGETFRPPLAAAIPSGDGGGGVGWVLPVAIGLALAVGAVGRQVRRSRARSAVDA